MNPLPSWTPKAPQKTRLAAFIRWVEKKENLQFSDYNALHLWSVKHFPRFWQHLADFFDFPWEQKPRTPFQKSGPALWQNTWFEGGTFNVANLMLNRGEESQLALICINEQGERQTYTYGELKAAVAAFAAGLQAAGVKQGCRVAAIMPNHAMTLIGMLASASLGALWASCSPDLGVDAAIDRFEQISPKVLLLCDGQVYAGKRHSALPKLPLLEARLQSLKQIVICPILNEPLSSAQSAKVIRWDEFIKPNAPLSPLPLPFSHPLYILFSSGTTGKPKCIVHGAGNTLLQHLKELALHSNLDREDHFFFYTTCGWMMWNWMVSGLALGLTLILYDGSPIHPSPSRLWTLIEDEKISAFGTSARYLAGIEKMGLSPKEDYDLSTLKTLFSTGSPLLPEQYDFVYKHIKADLQLSSISGGTDIVSCFALGNPMLPVYKGELQCIGLGLDVHVFNDQGQAVLDEKGELVCTSPFPSMPLYFWDDKAHTRYQAAYFARFKNTWTHGDFASLTQRQSLIIYGRSDTTLNPGGVRIGSAEIYRQLEPIDEIENAVVIGQPWKNDERIILFVKLTPPHTLTPALVDKIKLRLRTHASPRHVPALIVAVPDIPMTHNGKVIEKAVKQTLLGEPIKNLDAIANPKALAFFKQNLP